jgi:uncharacterized protein
VKYWDASALGPLLIDEPRSAWAVQLHASDDVVATWAWTRVEVASAIERRTRAGLLNAAQRREALKRVEMLGQLWHEITDLLAVRAHALSLMARHALRAADAGQLAAAYLLSQGQPADLSFVCLDERLADAADREGFLVQIAA